MSGAAETSGERLFFFEPGRAEGDPERVDLLGGKGSGLARLCRAGLPAPPGFTLSVACGAAIAADGRRPSELDAEIVAAVERLERVVGRRLDDPRRPLRLAVRSGAPRSMPGMLDTRLDVGAPERLRTAPAAERRAAALQALFEAIESVAGSWHGPRARAYRRRHGLSSEGGTAITVQALVEAERSGVLYTVDPHAPGSGAMRIESTPGGGAAVVSGSVSPDVDEIDAETFEPLRRSSTSSAGTPPLAPDRLAELARYGRRIAELLGAPADVEWAWADGRFAVLQARPVAGLEVAAELPRARRDQLDRLRELSRDGRRVWVEHDLAESLPRPTPLTGDLIAWMMSGKGGYGRFLRRLGFRPSPDVDDAGCLETIAGRPYVDARNLARMFYGPAPLGYDLDALAADPTLVRSAPNRFNPDDDPTAWRRVPSLVWRLLRAAWCERRAARDAAESLERFVESQLEPFLAECSARSLAGYDDRAIVEEFLRRRDFVLGPLAAESLLPGHFGAAARARLVARLTLLLGPDEAERTVADLTAGLDDDVAVEQSLALEAAALGERSTASFLARFGHRAVEELELARPRFREDPEQLEPSWERFRRAAGRRLSERHAERRERRRAAESGLLDTLARAGGASLYEPILADLHVAQRLLPGRELGRFHLLRGYAELRPPLLELARRSGLEGDLFFLRLEELSAWSERPETLRRRTEERRLRGRALGLLPVGRVVDSRSLERFGETDVAGEPGGGADRAGPSDGDVAARPLAAGRATGAALIARSIECMEGPADGYVLVCESLDPGWAPWLAGAVAAVVQRGGSLSHGATVAREFGVPAVVLDDALRRIPPGARVEVDAGAGRVRWSNGES